MSERATVGTEAEQGRPPVPSDTLALLAALLSNAPFGFAFFDTDLRYVHINDPLAALNARTPQEHLGLRPADISPELAAMVSPLLRRVLATGESILGQEFTAQAPGDPERRDWLLSAYPVTSDQGVSIGVAVAVVDVTDRRRTMGQLQAQARQLTAVVEIGMAALRGESVRGLVPIALATVRQVLRADRTALLRSDDGGSHFVIEATDPPDPALDAGVIVRPGDRSLCGATLASQSPVVSSDVMGDDRFDTFAAAGTLPLRSGATVLIPGGDTPFGVLGVYYAQVRAVGEDELQFVQAIANVIGTAVQRRRTERALEASDARLRMAQEAGRVGVWEWDLKSGTIIWSEALEHLWGLPAGGFGGTWDSFRALVHPDDLDRVKTAVEQALHSGGYETEHRIIRADNNDVRWIVARGDTIRDDAGAPVKMIGINVDITERKVVEEERFSLLRAEQAARAEAERARERLTFLSEATGVLSASLDYNETLQSLTRLAVPDHADTCVVDLLEVGRLKAVAVAHADADGEQRMLALRRRYPAAIAPGDPTHNTLRYGQPLMFSDASEDVLASMAVDAEHLEMLRQLDITSGIIVPLLARGRVLGTLSLLRTGGRIAFETSDDQTLVMELGRRAALAIDNARLFEATSRTGERFRRMAETLQASLLPPNLPTIAGVDVAARYRAAAAGTSVGGDFYDVFALPDRGWGVAIGDVQGKGTEAATVTGIARHTIRTAAMRRNPAGSLHVLNEALLQGEEHGGRFCTVLYGQMEVVDARLELQLASGGHPPALLRRADGTVRTVGGGGTLMGVVDNLSLHIEQVSLDLGDLLVLYTDGVTEARGPGGEFGERRLIKTVGGVSAESAEEVTTAIDRAVTDFSEGRFRDDMAILVLRATGEV